MCLYTKYSIKIGKKHLAFVHRAHKDIEVFKVLDWDNTSPFQKMKYQHGLNQPVYPYKKRFLMDREIKDGFLHAFVSERAVRLKYPWAIRVIKMIIPKGSLYVKGCVGDIGATCLKW